MKSTLAPLEGNKVKLSIEVDEAEFDRDIDAAFKKIAREVKLPGFRNGKAPRRVLESRLGLAPARQQALQDGIPQYLAQAVKEHDVDLIAPPQVELTAGEEDGPIAFDAECEVRPVITVPGYGGLRVEVDSVEATDEEIEQATNAELKRHAPLVEVDRPVQEGDFVVVDIGAERDGEPVPGLNVDDWAYEVGKGWVSPSFDQQLIGSSAGDDIDFTDTPSGTGEEADFTVTVQKVQVQELAEPTDEWVSENIGEFDTVAEWQQSIADRIAASKMNNVRQVFGERCLSSLAELVDDEPPKAMVDNELNGRVQNFVQQLARQGIPVDRWLELTGQDQTTFIEGLRGQSERAVKIDLALRAVAVAEGMEITDDELNHQFERIAAANNQKVNKVRQAYERNDAVADLTSQMLNNKALEWLMHRVEIVDVHGKPLSNDEVLGHSLESHDHDHDGHDHDHDHEGESA